MVSNPVSRSDVIIRFRDWVTYVVNSNITWGTNNWPHSYLDWNGSGRFGGTTSGISDGLSDPASFPTNPAIAVEVVRSLEDSAYAMTSVRNMRSVVIKDGDPTETLYDATAVAHLSSGYRGLLGSVRNRPNIYNIKNASLMEDYLYSLRQSYESIRNSTVYFEDHVCHNSCHSNCHSSRGRR